MVDVRVEIWKISDGEADVEFDLSDERNAVLRYPSNELLQGLQVSLMSGAPISIANNERIACIKKCLCLLIDFLIDSPRQPDQQLPSKTCPENLGPMSRPTISTQSWNGPAASSSRASCGVKRPGLAHRGRSANHRCCFLSQEEGQ